MKVTLAKPPYLISAHPLSSGLFGTFPPIIGHVFTNDELNVNMLKTLTKMETSLQKLPAKVLEPADLARLHQAVSKTKYVARNQVMCALSLNGGLRACEISGLTWPMVLGPSGRMKGTIDLGMGITKGGRFRTIPVSDALMKVMKKLHKEMGKPTTGPVILSERGNAMTPRSVVNWFKSTYTAAGLEGCTSHSGRRTFITTAARNLSKVNGSLRDVQELAGHRSLSTTERYIQGDRTVQRQLVNLI